MSKIIRVAFCVISSDDSDEQIRYWREKLYSTCIVSSREIFCCNLMHKDENKTFTSDVKYYFVPLDKKFYTFYVSMENQLLRLNQEKGCLIRDASEVPDEISNEIKPLYQKLCNGESSNLKDDLKAFNNFFENYEKATYPLNIYNFS